MGLTRRLSHAMRWISSDQLPFVGAFVNVRPPLRVAGRRPGARRRGARRRHARRRGRRVAGARPGGIGLSRTGVTAPSPGGLVVSASRIASRRLPPTIVRFQVVEQVQVVPTGSSRSRISSRNKSSRSTKLLAQGRGDGLASNPASASRPGRHVAVARRRGHAPSTTVFARPRPLRVTPF